MTLTKYEDLQYWFNSNQSSDESGTGAVHWTLYGGNYGEKEIRLMSNTRVNVPSESLAFLVDTIRRMNNPSGAKFRVQIYKPGSPNNYTAQTFVQVFDGQQNPELRQQTAVGIGNLPAHMGESYIQERIDLALLRKENEELKNAATGTESLGERIFKLINENPEISSAIAGLITSVAAKNGLPVSALPRPVTGSPESDDNDGENPETVFIQNIQQAAGQLNTDPVSLAKGLNRLIQQNPEFAKQIFSQA